MASNYCCSFLSVNPCHLLCWEQLDLQVLPCGLTLAKLVEVALAMNHVARNPRQVSPISHWPLLAVNIRRENRSA